MKTLIAALVVCGVASSLGAADWRHGTPCCWEALFLGGTVDGAPCGATRGTVLYADGKCPRVTARLQGVVWKGKTFYGDGCFTNRWLGGVQAVSADVRIEPSWLDGRPCLVMQYPANAAVFGNVRDELRQIGPGEWLGRSYDSATGRGKNWFVLREW